MSGEETRNVEELETAQMYFVPIIGPVLKGGGNGNVEMIDNAGVFIA